MPQDPDTVGRFFEYRAMAMQGIVSATREIISHSLSKGVEAETALAEMLAGLLPERFDARKGFLIDSTGAQSHELDLIIVDRNEIARMFDFRSFELVPIEAASGGVEVKTSLTKPELEDTFHRFQQIQDMTFFEERLVRLQSDNRGAGLVTTTTSRPELALFAYESSISNDAIRSIYNAYPDLSYVKICILTKGIVATIDDSPAGPLGLRLIVPVEPSPESLSGRVLALFLYQLFLPSLFQQTKGARFYTQYLRGESSYLNLQ